MFVKIISRPGTTREHETGSWRMGLKPQFLREKCIDCSLCALLCPEGVLKGSGKNTYQTDYRYCKGCGICAEECPEKDIIMVKEEDEA